MKKKKRNKTAADIRICSELMNFRSGINAIHVAGTNGKGSVCWKMSSALQKAGYKVGLFLSPHISSFRERVRINDELISEKDVKRLITEVGLLHYQCLLVLFLDCAHIMYC